MELTSDQRALLRRAIRLFEAPRHWGQLIEECAELVVAIRHRDRGRITDEQVAEEVADVLIVAEKARLMLGPEMVDRIMAEKLERFDIRVTTEEARRKAGFPPRDF